MTGAEHPLVATHRAHAVTNLVGERLEAERTVAGGKSTGDRGTGPMVGLRCEEDIDRFLKAPFQQVFEAGKRN